MRVIPLSAYLDRGSTGSTGAPAAASAAPQVTREEELAEARREGERLGREAARGALEAELNNERQAFEARLAEERRVWTETQGGELAQAIGDGFSRIEAAVAEVTARILEPLIVADAHRKALAELKETLGDILSKPEVATLHIAGPQDLLAILRDSFGQKNNVVFTANTGPDIHVEIGNTVIETRLEPWAARLREAMR